MPIKSLLIAIATITLFVIYQSSQYLYRSIETHYPDPQEEDDVVVVEEEQENIITILEEQPPTIDTKELECLAKNIYHEARSELLIGQYAVADVTLNRVESKKYPNTICEVVYDAQYSQWGLERNKRIPLKHRCQFSWYCDGKTDEIREDDAYQRAKEIAYNIVHHDKYRHLTEHATHYHTHYVDPRWNKSMNVIGTIGNHIFYRED